MTACLTAARQPPSIRDNDKRTAAALAYSHLETNAYTGRIEDYQRMQYDRLFDGGAAAALYQG